MEKTKDKKVIYDELLIMQALKGQSKKVNEIYWQNYDHLKNVKIPEAEKLDIAFQHAMEEDLITDVK